MKQAKSTKPAKPTNHSKKKSMKKRSKAVKAIVITLTSLMAVVAVLFIGGGIYLWNLAGKINYDDPSSGNWMPEISDPAEIDPPDPLEPGQSEVSDTINPDDLDHYDKVSDIPLKGNTKDIFNILLLGIDGENNTYSGRSDSNIIVSVNTKTKTIKLVSLMRDTCVLIPGYDINKDGKDDYARINVAFASGGVNRLKETIEKNFRLDIDQYIGVNFTVFQKIVDTIGGLDVTLTEAETYWVFAGTTKPAGTYHLNGKETLAYSRIRKIGSDFGRVQRQQKVLELIFEKISKDPILMMDVINNVLPEMRTNISKSEIMGYMTNILTYASYDMQLSYRIPQDGLFSDGWLRGAQVLMLKDLKATTLDLHKYLYG